MKKKIEDFFEKFITKGKLNNFDTNSVLLVPN